MDMDAITVIAEAAIIGTGHSHKRPRSAGYLADAILARLAAAGVEISDELVSEPAVLAVANAIRAVDGNNTLPAADLAETAVLALQHNSNVWQPGAKRRRSP